MIFCKRLVVLLPYLLAPVQCLAIAQAYNSVTTPGAPEAAIDASATGQGLPLPGYPAMPHLKEALRASRKPSKGSMDGRRGDPPGKYFHESVFHPHYDGRYAVEEVPYNMRRHTLSNLIRAYLITMNEIGAESWIMHGSLMGWWWNKRILPWDTDLDVMVSELGIAKLATSWNMSVHHFHDESTGTSTDYLLEINPNYRNTSMTDHFNWIDGRWVDTETGMYIDITTLHESDIPGWVRSKDNHSYQRKDIFPLKKDLFEGMPCLIPAGSEALLVAEYGLFSLVNEEFMAHQFDQSVMDWVPVTQQSLLAPP